jgi:hypothetical protein
LNLEVQLAKTLFLLEIVPGLFLNALSKPATQPPLLFLKPTFSTTQEPRAIDLVAVLVGVEVLQPKSRPIMVPVYWLFSLRSRSRQN